MRERLSLYEQPSSRMPRLQLLGVVQLVANADAVVGNKVVLLTCDHFAKTSKSHCYSQVHLITAVQKIVREGKLTIEWFLKEG